MTISRTFHGFRILAGALITTSFVGVAACSGGGEAAGPGGKTAASAKRVETITHEDCDVKSNRVENLDSNNDNKSDIQRVYDKKSGAEICRIVDLNHDTKPDMYEYFEANGQVRRREYSYDDSGSVNAVEYYEGGKLVRREYDTTGQHRIDTWDFFDPAQPPSPKTGRAVPVRRERDTNGNGTVDQWWVWDGEKITITVDRTGTGKPDPENTIVLNDPDAGASQAPPPSPPASTGDSTPDSGASGVATSPDAGTKVGISPKDGGKP